MCELVVAHVGVRECVRHLNTVCERGRDQTRALEQGNLPLTHTTTNTHTHTN